VNVYEDIPVELLDPDPEQPRFAFHDIQELADSLRHNGQLQNIIVEPYGERFIVKAGGRRLKAAQLLIEQKHWLSGSTLGCIVRTSLSKADGLFIGLTENESRVELPPWRAGYKYQELVDYGCSHQEIAGRVGKPAMHISYCCQIARGLHPNLVPRLDRVPNLLTRTQVLAISKILNDELGPDYDAQLKAFLRAIDNAKKPRQLRTFREPKTDLHRLKTRWANFKKGLVHIPAEYREAIEAFTLYLEGKGTRIYLKDEQP
jgi:ParB/RepB/Spo0J family partition protein